MTIPQAQSRTRSYAGMSGPAAITALTAVAAAEATKARYPGAPIIVLSDVYDLPADIAPYARAFVRKGEPATLVATLAEVAKQTMKPDSVA